MKSSLCSLVISVVLVGIFPLAAQAENDLEVFSSKSGLAKNWKAVPWSGLIVAEVPVPGKGTTLEVNTSDAVEPYSGVSLSAEAGNGFKVSEKFLKKGSIALSLKIGKTAQGKPAGAEQPVQIGITFLTTKGETVHGAFSTRVVLKTAGQEQVKVPMADALKEVTVPLTDLASISGIRIQHVDNAEVGFSVLECTIEGK